MTSEEPSSGLKSRAVRPGILWNKANRWAGGLLECRMRSAE